MLITRERCHIRSHFCQQGFGRTTVGTRNVIQTLALAVPNMALASWLRSRIYALPEDAVIGVIGPTDCVVAGAGGALWKW